MNIAYIRTSKEDQHPENQKDDLIKLAGDLDLKFYREQASAWKLDSDKRPIFSEVKDLIMNGKVNALYVWDLDRIYRNRKKLISFFKLCQTRKCQVFSHRQQWLLKLKDIPEPFDEMMHDLMLQIMGWLAEEESNKRSERVRAAMKIKKGSVYSKNGKKWGRKGFSNQTVNRILDLRDQHPNLSIRKFAELCYYYDENNNKKKMSLGAVHKILSKKSKENLSF